MNVPIFFKRNTIQRKLLSSTILTVIITIFICFISTTIYLEPYLRSIFARDTQYAVQNCSHQINYYMDEAMTYAKDISFNALIQEVYTTTQKKNTYQYFRLLLDVENYLDQYIILHDNILSDIFLLDETGKPMEIRQKYSQTTSTPIYSELIRPETKSGFSLPHQVVTNKDSEKFNVVAYVCNINNADAPNDFMGKIVILIKYEELVKPLYSFGNNYSLFLLNRDQQLIYPKTDHNTMISEHNAYIIKEKLAADEWSVVGVILNKHIYEGVYGILKIMFFIMLFCSLMALIAACITTKKLVGPLEALVGAMKKVSAGDRSIQVQINSRDEIEEAANVFNHMVLDINTYTRELLVRDKKEYEMTMQMLIYQINPHFVYNTLNCIICLARKKSYEEIIKLTRVFIVLLQATLRTSPDTMTTIEEEIVHTNHYVSVLQYSYENIAPVIWHAAPSLMGCQIPRLLLYPLVENSIFHGILTSSHACSIIITIETSDKGCVIRVEDNGCGMSAKTLSDLRKGLAEERITDQHIGLGNVNNRLRLLYGDASQLVIESQPEFGTVISFCIPPNDPSLPLRP